MAKEIYRYGKRDLQIWQETCVEKHLTSINDLITSINDLITSINDLITSINDLITSINERSTDMARDLRRKTSRIPTVGHR